MIVFPPAKINLGLHIISKRPDGFHNLETIFYPLPLYDGLEVIAGKPEHFTGSGLPIPGKTLENLCWRAYTLLRNNFSQIPEIQVHLHKVIPLGAGLGGGSSDGAWMLRLLNDKFSLGLEKEILANYAADLGSDCPFFIHNTPCFATGRGEILEEIPLSLQEYSLLLVYPGMSISTQKAFSETQLVKPDIP
ncbi:MAG: 4-(cytidine 5'-diphospho)-2-C-methyl-D-erythritol kinase, partial [Chitinophagaceae bacterium]